MRLSKIILIILVLLSLFVLIKTFTSKKETPVKQEVSTQAPENQAEQNTTNENNGPNALNVIAPYYNNTQKKVQSVQEIRQQTIKEEQELLGGQD